MKTEVGRIAGMLISEDENITPLQKKMAEISRLSTIVGVTVVSGLAVSFVKFTIPLKYVKDMGGGKVSEVAVQTMLDKIAPNLLPALFTAFIFYLIRKFKWNTYKLILLTLVIGIVGSYIGFIG